MTVLTLVIAMIFVDDSPAKKAEPKVKNPQLRSELLERVKADQAARMALIEFTKRHSEDGAADPSKMNAKRKAQHDKLLEAVRKADAENTKWLAEVVDKHGWPTRSLVGMDASHAAWLLVQHADADPKLQRKCLDLMEKAPNDEVLKSDLAYLADRVLLAEGKKQRYGTQFTNTNGKWEPRPLEDPENVDRRRKEVGLPPLSEYVKMLEKMYGAPAKKSP